jgi:hypothetical protein
MITFLPLIAIFSCGLSGLLGLPAWIVALAAVGLATVSYVRHLPLFRRAGDLGMQGAIDQTLIASLINGLLAAAYGCGVVLRVLSAG